MPIISGSSGAAAAAGAWSLLSQQTITGGPANFDFNNIDQTKTDLLVIASLRGSNASTGTVSSVVCNADTTAAHYSYNDTEQSATSNTTSWVQNGAGNGFFMLAPGDTALANSFGAWEIFLFGYASTVWLKQIKARSNTLQSNVSGGLVVDEVDGFWNSTAAITRVQLQGNSGNTFKVGSVASLYAR